MTQTAEKTADVQAQDYKVADMSLAGWGRSILQKKALSNFGR